MKTSVFPRQLLRICKSTANYMQTTNRLVNMTLQLTNERLRCRETLKYCLGYKFRLLPVQPPMQFIIAYGKL